MRVWLVCVLILLALALAAIVIPVYCRPQGSRQDPCMSNLHGLCLAFRMYAQDNHGRLPDASTWMGALQSYVSSDRIFHCPADREHQYSYAMNAEASGIDVAKLDGGDAIIVVHESDIGRRNASAPLDRVTGTQRHDGFVRVAFLGGDVQMVSLREWPPLRLLSDVALGKKLPAAAQPSTKATAPAPAASRRLLQASARQGKHPRAANHH